MALAVGFQICLSSPTYIPGLTSSLTFSFKNLAQGIPPEVHEIEAPPSGDQLDYNSAVQRLKSFEEKLMAKTGKVIPEKRKKGGEESTEDTGEGRGMLVGVKK